MKLLTGSQMRDIDHLAIETYGIPGLVLMENAGAEVARQMFECFPDLKDKQVLVVCGKGNNGGDGFVIARRLHNKGVAVQIVLLAHPTDLPPDAFTNYMICTNMQIPLMKLITMSHLKLLEKLLHSKVEVVIDAVLGTGFTSGLKPFIAKVVNIINASGVTVVAVDIPTGLSSTTGAAAGSAVRADLTVTFALPKIGHYLQSSRELVGKLKVVDIGIPPEIYGKDNNLKVELLEKETVKSWIPSRQPDSHKGSYGHTLVVAGSKGMSGAAFMTAYGAYRAGAGKVTLAVPQSIQTLVAAQLPEMLTVGLPESPQGFISLDAVVPILNLSKDKSVVVVGPGLSNNPEIRAVAAKLIDKFEIPMVIDADGINAIKFETLKFAKTPVVLTPHPGEMARLMDKSIAYIQENRLDVARKNAVDYQCCFALKGDHTVIAGSDSRVFINPTGNPGMATGGSGDVLSGMIGGLISRGLEPFQATAAAVYLHGLAGDLAADEIGEECLMASDILDYLSKAYREIRK